MTYEEQLLEAGSRLMEPLRAVKMHHKFLCIQCNHEWTTTPVFIKRTYKRNGTNGCPVCNQIRIDNRRSISRAANIQTIKDRGFEILSDWDGRRADDSNNNFTRVTLRNTACGHEFTSEIRNVLSRGVQCPTCARVLKTANINKSNAERYDKWCKTAPDWLRYKKKVQRLTRMTYTRHKHIINPLNLPIGRAGTHGAYQVDHIKSIRWCYDNDIDERHVAALENLQMLPWLDNIKKRDKVIILGEINVLDS